MSQAYRAAEGSHAGRGREGWTRWQRHTLTLPRTGPVYPGDGQCYADPACGEWTVKTCPAMVADESEPRARGSGHEQPPSRDFVTTRSAFVGSVRLIRRRRGINVMRGLQRLPRRMSRPHPPTSSLPSFFGPRSVKFRRWKVAFTDFRTVRKYKYSGKHGRRLEKQPPHPRRSTNDTLARVSLSCILAPATPAPTSTSEHLSSAPHCRTIA